MDWKNQGTYLRNAGYAMVAGQSGCMTTVIVLGALILGLWLDSILGTSPALTLTLTLVSVPLSLVIMVYTVLGAARRITPPNIKTTDDDNELAE